MSRPMEMFNDDIEIPKEKKVETPITKDTSIFAYLDFKRQSDFFNERDRIENEKRRKDLDVIEFVRATETEKIQKEYNLPVKDSIIEAKRDIPDKGYVVISNTIYQMQYLKEYTAALFEPIIVKELHLIPNQTFINRMKSMNKKGPIYSCRNPTKPTKEQLSNTTKNIPNEVLNNKETLTGKSKDFENSGKEPLHKVQLEVKSSRDYISNIKVANNDFSDINNDHFNIETNNDLSSIENDDF